MTMNFSLKSYWYLIGIESWFLTSFLVIEHKYSFNNINFVFVPGQNFKISITMSTIIISDQTLNWYYTLVSTWQLAGRSLFLPCPFVLTLYDGGERSRSCHWITLVVSSTRSIPVKLRQSTEWVLVRQLATIYSTITSPLDGHACLSILSSRWGTIRMLMLKCSWWTHS